MTLSRLAHRCDLVVVERLLVLGPIDPELRFDLAQGAFRPIERELQLARLETNEHVSEAHLRPELHRDLANDAGHLAADSRLIGGEQRARQIDLALYRHLLHGGGLDADRLPAPSAAAAPAGAAVGLPGRLLARGRGDGQRDESNGSHIHFLLVLYAVEQTNPRCATSIDHARPRLLSMFGIATVASAGAPWTSRRGVSPGIRWRPASHSRAPSMYT